MTQIDLGFLNEGKELVLTLAQLKAMDQELQQIAQQAPEIIALAQAFSLTYAQAQKLTAELKLAPDQLRRAVATMASLKAVGADATTQYAVFAKQLGLSVDQMQLLSTEVQALGDTEPIVESLASALGQLFILDKIEQFKSSVQQTGQVFETLNTRLKTTLGTQAAATEALGRIQAFAATTPFELIEVTDSFVKLKQRGIEPTNDALRNLGDIASSQGKSLDQATEALLDASQGEFERLREFGIRASAAGDKVNISFQGVNTQVERTPEAITAGLLALGELEGVAGGMAEQAKTLGGSLSNLKDSQDKLAASAFNLIQPLAVGLVQAATGLINGFFELDPILQKSILTVGLLGTAVTSAVVAIAAFQTAQVGATLATAASTVAKIPNAVATGTMATVTKLAALAELDLTKSKIGGVGASAAKTVALGAETAATAANTAATAANTAATAGSAAAAAAGAKSFVALAAAAGTITGFALGAAASWALVAETYLNVTSSTREAEKASQSLAESFEAIDEATAKRIQSAQLAATAEASAAEARAEAEMSIAELAAANAAKETAYADAYAKDVDKRVSIVQKIVDKVREFLNLPSELFSKTFEIIAKVPAPQIVQDFFSGVSQLFEATKLDLARDKLIDGDAIASGIIEEDINNLAGKFNELKASAQGSLGNASRQEVEALGNAYEKMIEQVEAQVPANQQAATIQALRLRQLRQERDEVAQSLKLIQERERRVEAAGTAEEQWASQIERTQSNLRKQIATSEDAQKQLETTAQQLQAGAIDPATAEAQFRQVAEYAAASAEVQADAVSRLRSLRESEASFRKAELDVQIAQEEVNGIMRVQTEEQTAARIAEIRAQQAGIEVERLKKTLSEEESAGRQRGIIYRQASQDLAKALAEQDKANTDATIANRKVLEAEITDALEDAAEARKEAETRSAIASKQAVLSAVRSGNQSIEEAEKASDRTRLATQQRALADEITAKRKAQAELESIGGEEQLKQAEKLGQEILSLQEQQLDLELEAVRKAQQERLEVIREAEDKRKAILARDNATADEQLAQRELAILQAAGLDRNAALEQLGQERLAIEQRQATEQLRLTQTRIANIRRAESEGLISQKDAGEQILELEVELANRRTEVVRNQIEQQNQLEQQRLRVLEQAMAQRQAMAEAEQAAIEQQRGDLSNMQSLMAAEERLFNARASARRIATRAATQELEIAKQLAEVAGDTQKVKRIEEQLDRARVQALIDERANIEAQFAFKAQSLELDIAANKLANEQLRIQKELAVLEAEQAIQSAIIEGKSKEEIALLQQKLVLSRQALDSVNRSAEVQDRIADMQRDTLGLERANALNENANELRGVIGQQEVDKVRERQAERQQSDQQQQPSRGGGGGGGDASSVNSTMSQVSATISDRFAPSIEGAGQAAEVLSTQFNTASTSIGNAAASIARMVSSAPAASGQLPPPSRRKADGGPAQPGAPYLVGEEGPELVTFAQASYVHTAKQTEAMLQAAKAASLLQASSLEPVRPMLGNGEVVEQLRQLIRVASDRQVSPVTVPVTVQQTDSMGGAAEALALIRADRARRASRPFG